MRTHGSKQQREAVKRVPKKQIEPIFEVWEPFDFIPLTSRLSHLVIYVEPFYTNPADLLLFHCTNEI